MKKVILLPVSILLICLAYAFAAVPCKINYQGRLIKDNVPVHNTAGIPIIFKLFNTATDTGGEKVVYSGNVPVYNGLFRVVLDLEGVNWTAGETKYLQVIVDEEPLSPREALYAYPYAINSHLLEGATKEYFLNTSGETQKKDGGLNIMGNVGIGTTEPEAPLDIKRSAATAMLKMTGIKSNTGGSARSESLDLVKYNDTVYDVAAIRLNLNTFFDSSGELSFWTRINNTAGYTEKVRITNTGKVGIGTTSPQAKLHISGTSGTDGIMFPDETVQTTAAAGFGSWTNKDSQNNTLVVNAVYKAECDGFVCGAAYGASHGMGSIEGFTDGSNPPTTRRVGSGSGYVDVNWSGITMPVKKNDYWKVTTYNMKTPSISWIPIGSGSCVKQ